MANPTASPREPQAADSVSSARFVVTALLTSVINLVLNAAGYALVLKDVYRAHPSGSEEFMKELHRPPDQLVVWAMVVTSLTMGLFITTMMRWSGAKTFAMGLKRGAILGFLYWISINSGIYASSNLFSLPAVLVDTPLSALSMTISAACAVWMMSRGHRAVGRHGEPHAQGA